MEANGITVRVRWEKGAVTNLTALAVTLSGPNQVNAPSGAAAVVFPSLSLAPDPQILCQQRHPVLLPQGLRGLPAETHGALRVLPLQGERSNAPSQRCSFLLLTLLASLETL